MSERTEPDTRTPTPFERFTKALLAVPKKELREQEAAHEREKAANPRRAGRKSSVSRVT